MLRRSVNAKLLALAVMGVLLGLWGGAAFMAQHVLAQAGDAVLGEQPPGTTSDDPGRPVVPKAYSAELRRYPYLTDVVGPYATINWATTTTSTVGSVTWGQVGVEACTANTAPAVRASITISGVTTYQWTAPLTLTTGTQYCYRPYLGAIDLLGSDPAPQFWTQVPTGSAQPFSFAVFGDWGLVYTDGQNIDQANLMAQLAARGPRFAFVTGDMAYPAGSQSNYGDLVQVGASTSAVFGPAFWTVVGATTPLFPSLGNHGFYRSETNHPYLLNWPQTRAAATSGGRYLKETYCCRNGTIARDYPSAWYAFDAGNARFYVLEATWDDGNMGTVSNYQNDYNNHWEPSSPEYQWLEQDLATHPTALKFAFTHYPMYSDSTGQPSDTFLQGTGSLEGLLSRNGVDILFSGHAHNYQRNVPPHANSLVTYVTGGGGADLGSIGSCSSFDAYGIGWSDTTNQGRACGAAPTPVSRGAVYHFLLVQVNGTQVTVEPVNSLGSSFDVVAYNFNQGTPTPGPTPDALFTSHTTWQGRPAQPNALQALPITLTLKLNNTTYSYPNLTTSASGSFTLSVLMLPAGTYSWWAKGPQYLANGGTVTLTGRPTTLQELGTMLAGDVNDDNLVDISDFTLLRATFGKTCADGGYDGRADFTGDCLVDITDFTLQRNNFGLAGAPPP